MTPLATVRRIHHPSIHVRVQRADPTRTKLLRDSFEREMRKRFNRLKAVICRAIVDQDCFGLTNPAGFRVFFNPCHDERGRFCSTGGGVFDVKTTDLPYYDNLMRQGEAKIIEKPPREYPILDYKDRTQEGRARALAAEMLGIGKIPVLVIQKELATHADPQAPTFRQFDFPTSQAKKDAFLAWLKKQEELGILETMRLSQFGQATEAAWTDVFIKDSYERGVQRARYEMGRAGYPVPTLEATGGLVGSMSMPIHVERLGVVYSRAFDQLKGITSAMDSQISHILAQGLADGDNPIPLARKFLATIDGKGMGDLGITDSLGRFIPAERRARMLARTEIIRAHAQATLSEYERWAVAGVEVEAEFVNSGFNVCPVCEKLQGRRYTIAEARNVIPVHPHCRCGWLPRPIEKIRKVAQ